MTISRSSARRATFSALAFGLLIAAVTAGSASAQQNYSATPEQRKACTPDVYRLCAGEIPSAPKITACLRAKRDRLSPACAALFER